MSLLFVCTGNVCRSAVAERLASRWLGSDTRVQSAGTRATGDLPMHPSSAAALATLGAKAGGFLSRRVDEALLDEADLVLTMTAEHRQTLLNQAPRTLRRTFTLREAATLCGSVNPAFLATIPPEARAAALAGLLSEARATRVRGRHRPDGDDVPDPIGQDPAFHLDTARLVATNVRVVVDALLARPSEPTVILTRRPPVPGPARSRHHPDATPSRAASGR